MVKNTSLDVSKIKHKYDDKNFVLKEINFDILEGDILSILGPSGCGKSTLLRLIAGLEKLKYGKIEIFGKTVADKNFSLAPNLREVGLVHQDRALFPHLSVIENVKFGIKGKKYFRNDKALNLLSLFKVDQYANSYPNSISGGEQQRVAIARAIAPNPKILLMDEPFDSLDEALRNELRQETKKIIKSNNITCILVTHDFDDASAMADKIIELKAVSYTHLTLPTKRIV